MSEVSNLDVNEQDVYGTAALHYAVQHNDIEQVELLLSKAANVNIRDGFNKTPLHYAAEKNVGNSHLKVAEILLKNAADANVYDQYDRTPFIYLVEKANIEMVKLFLNFDVNINVMDFAGCNLLFPAVRNCENVEVLQLLVNLGLDVNRYNVNGKTPLHEAAISNIDDSHFEIVEILLKNGANVNARNDTYRTPLYYLVQKGSVKIVQLLLDFKANYNITYINYSILFFAVHNCKNPEVMQLLIDLNLNVNHRSADGKTPLHEVAEKNVDDSHFKVAEILLKNLASVNARDNKGRTPFHYLVQKGNLKIVNLFLNFKADAKIVCFKGQTLLISAVSSNKNVDVVRLLIDLGLSVHDRSTDGKTPLHWACMSAYENIKIIKCLLKNGADINALDYRGFTPLIAAVRKNDSYGHVEIKMKKSFRIILDHSDFNKMHHDVNVLAFSYGHHQDCLWKMVLQHLTVLKILSIPVHPIFLNTISCDKKYNDYYIKCEEELLHAKSTKLKNSWITFYNLMMDSKRKLKNYAGNSELIEDFKISNCNKKFPIYGALMIENVKKGIKKRKSYDKSTILLSECLPMLNPSHLIIRDVLDCVVNKKDLSKFCDQN